MKYNTYVSCGGDLMAFKNNKEAQNFFLECMSCSEGSERDRYTTIFLELKDNYKFASDHSFDAFGTTFDLNEISDMDLDNIKDVYNLNDNDIDYIQTNYKLEKISKRIYNQDFNKYNQDFEEYYKNQSDKKDKYYLIDNDNNKIICFDYSCSEYFCEEFNLKDYNYAYQWLNNEIEYEDYLNRYKDEMDI